MPPSSNQFPSIRGAIAVQNYGVSGSTFLQSLLDEHPEIISLPGLYAQPLYPFFAQHQHLGFQALLEAFFQRFDFMFQQDLALGDANPVSLGLHQMGPDRNQPLVVSMMDFADTFEELYRPHETEPVGIRRRHFIIAVFFAYYAARAQKRPLADAVWILYPIHSLQFIYAEQLRRDFPQCRFIHMVRDPLRSLGSTMRFTMSHADWWMFDGLQRAIAQILNDYQMFAEIIRVNGYRPYFDTKDVPAVAIRLEDLHAHPKPLLNALCEWLGVRWDDCLLQSTFSGLQWWNRPESKRVSGFDQDIAGQKFPEFLTPRDRFILMPLLRRQYRAWGYEKPASTLRLLLHAPFLLLPLSREKPDDTTHKRYQKWRESSKGSWLRFRFGEYVKCRRWLFMAWQASLLDHETIVPLLAFDRHG